MGGQIVWLLSYNIGHFISKEWSCEYCKIHLVDEAHHDPHVINKDVHTVATQLYLHLMLQRDHLLTYSKLYSAYLYVA